MMFGKKAPSGGAVSGVSSGASTSRTAAGHEADDDSGFPLRQLLYQQIARILSRRILDQSLAEGSCLPNEYDLAREFHVSIGTVRKAIDILASRNLVERVQGKGTFVSGRHVAILRRQLNRFRNADGSPVENWNVRELDYRIEKAGMKHGALLRIDSAAEVHAIRRLRNVGRGPWILEDVLLPKAKFARHPLSAAERRSLMALLRSHAIFVGRIDEKVSTVPATAELAASIRAASGSPLLLIERTIFDETGDALEYRLSRCALGEGAHWDAGYQD